MEVDLTKQELRKIVTALSFIGNCDLESELTDVEEERMALLAIKLIETYGIDKIDGLCLPFQNSEDIIKYATNKKLSQKMEPYLKKMEAREFFDEED